MIEKLLDNRTVEEMKIDYDHGLEMENRIIEYLKTLWTVYTTINKDKRLNPRSYWPDCIILADSWILPLEVKYTKHDITVVHWKLNQYNEMQKWRWYLLQISWHRFCIIPRFEVWTDIDEEESYCNKPCKKFIVKRNDLSELKTLFY